MGRQLGRRPRKTPAPRTPCSPASRLRSCGKVRFRGAFKLAAGRRALVGGTMGLGCSWATGDDRNRGFEHHQELTSRLPWLLVWPCPPRTGVRYRAGKRLPAFRRTVSPREGCGHGLLCRCYLTNARGGFPCLRRSLPTPGPMTETGQQVCTGTVLNETINSTI